MRVGWLVDDPGFLGGAELTAREFRQAAPANVELVDCRPGQVEAGLDRYVIGNCVSYSVADLRGIPMPKVVKYVNDLWPYGDVHLRAMLLQAARLVFTSPLHVARFPHELANRPAAPELAVHEIPPALDLAPFEAVRGSNHRAGAVCVGRMAFGKGVDLLEAYSEPVDVYSSVSIPSGRNVRFRGALRYDQLPETLARYETFVFLPTALEPFGRAVVEAWAAGLKIVVNGNVGARYWIERNPRALETAAEDFWAVVLHG